MLSFGNVQQAQDLAFVSAPSPAPGLSQARLLATLKARVPFREWANGVDAEQAVESNAMCDYDSASASADSGDPAK